MEMPEGRSFCEREIAALERIAQAAEQQAQKSPRTWKDVWYGVPVGHEHMRQHYYTAHMRVNR